MKDLFLIEDLNNNFFKGTRSQCLSWLAEMRPAFKHNAGGYCYVDNRAHLNNCNPGWIIRQWNGDGFGPVVKF